MAYLFFRSTEDLIIMRSVIFIVIMFSCFNAVAPAAELSDDKNLFFIKRSKNTNEVHYDARVRDCRWRKEAIDSYWRMLAEGPDVYEEIAFYEESAYGFDVERLSNTQIRVRLKALPEREITVRLSRTAGEQCKPEATIELRGQSVELRSVYVFATENAVGWPKVHYINILGYSKDGRPVFERIAKTKRGRKLGASPPHESQWQSGAKTWGRS